MKKEIKYYKAEFDGRVELRQSKNDYTVATVREDDSGHGVVSFNSKELSKGAAIGKYYHSGWHSVSEKCVADCGSDNKYCKISKENYAAAKVYSVPAVQISKEEYNKIKEER